MWETKKSIKSGSVIRKQVKGLTHLRRQPQNNTTQDVKRQSNEEYPGRTANRRLFQTVSKSIGDDLSAASKARSVRNG